MIFCGFTTSYDVNRDNKTITCNSSPVPVPVTVNFSGNINGVPYTEAVDSETNSFTATVKVLEGTTLVDYKATYNVKKIN